MFWQNPSVIIWIILPRTVILIRCFTSQGQENQKDVDWLFDFNTFLIFTLPFTAMMSFVIQVDFWAAEMVDFLALLGLPSV